jgi:hypothetical protein
MGSAVKAAISAYESIVFEAERADLVKPLRSPQTAGSPRAVLFAGDTRSSNSVDRHIGDHDDAQWR